MDPIPAMNISIVAWLALQGIGMALLFQSLLNEWLRAILAATLALIAPQVLIASGNAQFENIAPFFFLLIGWSAFRKKPGWLFTGLLCTGFSSPYMGFLGLLLAICIGYRNVWTWVTTTVTSLFVWVYYNAVTKGHIHESTLPAPSQLGESADFKGLLVPLNNAENARKRLPDQLERIQTLYEPTSSFDDTWFWVMATASSFLGISVYTWTHRSVEQRKDRFVRGLCLWMGIAQYFPLD